MYRQSKTFLLIYQTPEADATRANLRLNTSRRSRRYTGAGISTNPFDKLGKSAETSLSAVTHP